jgi:hypothetical protein
MNLGNLHTIKFNDTYVGRSVWMYFKPLRVVGTRFFYKDMKDYNFTVAIGTIKYNFN